MVQPVQSPSLRYPTTPLNNDQGNINSQDQVATDSSDEENNVGSERRSSDDLKQLNALFAKVIKTIEDKDQEIIKLQKYKAFCKGESISYKKRANGLKETDLALLEEFKDGRIKILSEFEVPGLMRVLENEMGDYEATDRAKAAAILGQQSALSKDVSSILKKVLKRQDEDKWVKIQSAIALSHYEPLSDEYIDILLDDIEDPTGSYEMTYRADAAIALCKQRVLSAEVRARLEKALEEKDQNIHLRAAISLGGRLPDKAIPILLETVKNKGNAAVDRANAVYAIGQATIWDKEIRSVLEEAFVEPNQDQWIKVEIAIALSSYVELSEAQVQILLNTIEDRWCPIEYRNDAAFALSRLSVLPENEKARFISKRTLQHEDKSIRLHAAMVLGTRAQLAEMQLRLLSKVVEDKNKKHRMSSRICAVLGLEQQVELSNETRATLKAALNDASDEISVRAAAALARKGFFLEKVNPILVKALNDKESGDRLRSQAAFGLGQQQSTALSSEALSALETALNDASDEVSVQAAVALARKGLLLEKVNPILVKTLKNKGYGNWLRGQAAFGLGRQAAALSDDAYAALEAALNDASVEVSVCAAVALARRELSLEKVNPILVKALNDKGYSDWLRGQAAFGLIEQTAALSDEDCSALEAALNDASGEVSVCAAVALARKDLLLEKVNPILVKALNHKRYGNWLRGRAASGLGQQAAALSEEVRSALETALNDASGEVRARAAVALARRGLLLEEVNPILVTALNNKEYDTWLRGQAAFGLSEQAAALSDEACSALEAARNDASGEVSVQAAVALARRDLSLEKVNPVLVKALNNKEYDNWLRSRAAFGLSEQTAALSDEARSALEASLDDASGEVSVCAAVALARRGFSLEKVNPILVKAFNDEGYSDWLRGQAAFGLSEQTAALSDEFCSDLLGAALNDASGEVSVCAAVALARRNLFLEEVNPILVKALNNKGYGDWLRGWAVFALGEQAEALSDEFFSDLLGNALNDVSGEVRVRAAVALARRNFFLKKVNPILVKALNNRGYNNWLRGQAVFGLDQRAALLDKVSSALRVALEDASGEVSVRAAVALARKNHFFKNVNPILVGALNNKGYGGWLRGQAALGLGEQTVLSDEARSALEASLNDASGEVSVCAAVALARKDLLLEKVNPILVKALNDKGAGDWLRNQAAFGLGWQAVALSDGDCSALEAAFEDFSGEASVCAAVALARRDRSLEKVNPILVKALNNEEYDNCLRGRAAFGLGEQTVPISNDAYAALEAALENASDEISIRAAVALVRKKRLPEKVNTILVGALKNKDCGNWLRRHAAFGLSEQTAALSEGDCSALQAALEDASGEIRVYAAIALARRNLFLKEINPILVKALNNTRYNNWLRDRAAFGLGQQTADLPEYACLALKAALNDASRDVRVQAAKTLALKNLF